MSYNFDNKNMLPTIPMKELGLSDEEVSIYLSLLRSGGAIASTVAKEVGMKRTSVYAVLKGLMQKGFVTMYYRKNKQLYYAEKPMRVANYFEKKLDAFTAIIPVLETLDKKQTQAFGLRFIISLDELKNFYHGVLEEYKGDEYCAIGSTNAWQGLEPDFFVQYRKDRAAAHIKTRILITEESRTVNPDDATLLRRVKFLPEKYRFKSTIDIFHDKVIIVSPELSSLAVVIAVPAMVDVFQGMFDMIWDFCDNNKK